jgi:hypothetical protein
MLRVDPLHAVIALVPLAAYLLLLGLVNLSRRPLVTSGARDAAALAVAISGFMIVGPLELFLIEEAAVLYGPLVWAMMLLGYALLALLVILVQRPRIVVYNISLEQLRPLLAEVVVRLDDQARWAGESLTMPQLSIHLHLEYAAMLHNVQLVSSGPFQNLTAWHYLEKQLALALRKTRHSNPLVGTLATLTALSLAAISTWLLLRDPAGMTQALNDMLRR